MLFHATIQFYAALTSFCWRTGIWATTVGRLMTAEGLLGLPRGDGRRYELIRGVLIEKMGTGDPHGISVNRIAGLIFIYTESLSKVLGRGPALETWP